MGERYDMDYVYYVDGSLWYGVVYYYEYLCVFVWVMIYEYFGVWLLFEVDFEIVLWFVEVGKVVLY